MVGKFSVVRRGGLWQCKSNKKKELFSYIFRSIRQSERSVVKFLLLSAIVRHVSVLFVSQSLNFAFAVAPIFDCPLQNP